MYSIKTQNRMVLMLYLLLVVIVVDMPFRYIHLLLHDMSTTYLVAKYTIVSTTALYLIVFLFMFFIKTEKKERKVIDKNMRDIFFIAFCVSIMGVVVGVVNNNRFYYLVGDTFRHVAPWVLLFMFLWMFKVLIGSGRMRSIENFFLILGLLGVIEAIATMVMRYYNPYLRISTNLYLWGIVWCLYQKKFPFLLVVPVMIVCMLASVASGKRSPVVLSTIIIFVYIVYLIRLMFAKQLEHRDFIIKVLEQFLVIILVGIIAFAFLPAFDSAFSKVSNYSIMQSAQATVQNVFEILSGKIRDESWEGRWVEWDNILDHMKDKPEYWVWGSGFGVEIEPYYPGLVLTPDHKMHTVHQAWGAYFLRSGILGIFLFFYFFAKLFWFFLKGQKQHLNWLYYCFTFILISFVASFSSNVMLESFGESFLGALLYALIFIKTPCSQVPVFINAPAQFSHYEDFSPEPLIDEYISKENESNNKMKIFQ